MNLWSNLCVVVLVKNEILHLSRFVNQFTNSGIFIYIIDSYSTDGSLENYKYNDNIKILTNPFETQAQQFNWALSEISPHYQWVLRLDADELIDVGDLEMLLKKLCGQDYYRGVSFKRTIKFRGKKLRFGGSGEKNCVRLFRQGFAFSNQAIMDEKLMVQGAILKTQIEIVDHSLITLSQWIKKHNEYSSREALNVLLKFRPSLAENYRTNITGGKEIFYRLPPILRSFLFFLYRLFFKLGFLDGTQGLIFILLQGFFYRLVVDIKISELKIIIENLDEVEEIQNRINSYLQLGINLKGN